MQQILFIGGGEIGAALAHVIGDRANIDIWDKDPKRASGTKPLEERVPDASVVFLCVPSWVCRDVLVRAAPLLRPDAVVVSLAKGIEADTLKTMDAVLEETLPSGQRCGILGGPLLAEELLADLPGIAVFASKDPSATAEIAPLFDGSRVRLEHCDDPRGVALVAVLKNVYAVGLGIADGLGWGWNGKGWLAAQAMREMKDIVGMLKDDATMVDGPAGAGDFLATAMSPDSRNREAGREIARSGSCASPGEGCRSISSVLTLVGARLDRLPFLRALDRILNAHENSSAVFQDLFAAR